MKKSYIKPKTNISKIPYSKISIKKGSLELSIPFSNKYKGKIKTDSIKDTFDGSAAESGILLNPQFIENLKNSKLTNSKDYSFNKLDNKHIFTYSLKTSTNQRNKSSNFVNNYLTKTQEENSENVSSSEDIDYKLLEKKSILDEDDDTNKIDYRYYPKIPEIEGNVDKNKSLYWLATYDKLMKKSKIMKILSYYSDSLSHKESEIFVIEDAKSDYKEEESKQRLKQLNEKYNFKEKTMIIQGYEIYFVKKHGKPFVRQKKDGKIFVKLYLLSLEQINKIFSYINRLEYKKYINNLDVFKQRNTFKIINNFNKTIYNYTKIFCLGSFMNINIYMFSHSLKNKEVDIDNNDANSANFLINNLPSSNKIAKIIKVLMTNFPEFSKQNFIDYLMKPKIYCINLNIHDVELLKQKINEVNSLLISDNKNELKTKNNNTNNTNNIIKRTIRAIPTNTLSSKTTTNDINSINYINNDVNCSDFLSNIKNELDGLVNIQKRNNKNKIENLNKVNKTKNTKIKSNNTVFTRNKFNIFDNINIANDSYMKSNNNRINKKHEICRTISLLKTNKKSLTRNNSNGFINFNISKNNDKGKEKEKQINVIKLNKKAMHRNKENGSNLINKNLLNKYRTEDNNFIYYNKLKQISKLEHDLTRTQSNKNLNQSKENNKTYSPYYTNINTLENNQQSKANQNTSYVNQPKRVLSTIQKLISKKINRVTPNIQSVFQINNNDSNKSLKSTQNNRYGTEISTNANKSKKNKKINSKMNNNSQNKISDFITPLKKKYFYYYH
jgi:hypothetical protein